MSTIAERARMEAERAEAEQPDENEVAEEEEPQPQPEPVPEPDPALEGLTEKQAEAKFKQLEGAAQRYLKTAMPITEALGLQVQACPLCTFPGLAIPRQAHEATSDVVSAVDALLGRAAGPALRESSQYERCPACDGWGDVLTGAQKEISRAAVCNECGGKGYKIVTNVTPIITTTTSAAYPGTGVTYQPVPGGMPDQWNRPAGHPHWGLEPSQVGS